MTIVSAFLSLCSRSLKSLFVFRRSFRSFVSDAFEAVVVAAAADAGVVSASDLIGRKRRVPSEWAGQIEGKFRKASNYFSSSLLQ